ncbi:aromatic ring-hydroxylating dioxygenase subunit alpha [Bacillus sp. FJAT-42376]|uniref:aromatic ring-hydroxylating oxygenase subunit alpha n=1 Tax=Bacillus sp. FJAT-42376 TaxID=2014076 RepID=UPI000F517325|nr:aromatic ring-hydroxylating dioxygenase subunit alpha [Bacillus sp. FJAT-42376]AZB42114.1 aromatic ring-hydroxylating dioxygenase subunit alpha [Bacillus sp. FJAT-42376]
MEENINRVFPSAWYAVAYSSELTKKPVRKKVIGREMVLYRDQQGEVKALHAFCPHRGADLSLGCVKNGELMCAYHGWKFDGDGTCSEIPSQPDKPIPKFAHTAAFPVTEEAGLIWVYPDYEAEEVPDFQVIPDIKESRYRLSPYKAHWDAHLTRAVESVLDVAHLSFVHKKTIGRNSNTVFHDLPYTHEGDSIMIQNGGGLLEYRFPQQWILRPAHDTKHAFINYVTFTPVDEEETMIFGYAGRTFAKKVPFMDRVFSKYSLKILDEDKSVVESQHPRPIPEALRMEAHVYADGPQIAFRKRWFEFLSQEEKKISLDEGVKVY